MKCKGPSCRGCSDSQCYSKGGEVSHDEDDSQKGVHDARGGNGPGASFPGAMIRSNTSVPMSTRLGWAKEEHRKKLDELKGMKKPNLYADGGSVSEPDPEKARQMQAGATSGGTSISQGWKNLKDGLGMADGGEVDADGDYDGDSEEDMELQSMACDELLESIEKKDKHGMLEAIRALVLSVR